MLHFADNKAADAAAVKGDSPAADLARIVGNMQRRWFELRIDPWVEFVKSEATLADEPSRGAFDTLVQMDSVAMDGFPWPPLEWL